MSDYVCPECGEECGVEPEDQGIGPYEFWGQRGIDTHMVMVSDCCQADMSDQISYGEWHYDRECDRADYEYDRRRDEQLEREWEKSK